MSNSNGNNGGIGLSGMLLILFVGLKLTGYITWSWWWVLAPAWIPLVFLAVLGIIYAILMTKEQNR